jgi:hypothetical protein
MQKESTIRQTEESHRAISDFEKYLVMDLGFDIRPPIERFGKKSTRIHIFKDLTMCKRMQTHFLPGGSYSVEGSIAHENGSCKQERADPGSRRYTNVSRGTGIFFQGP